MNIKPWRRDLKRWLETPAVAKDKTVFSASRHHQIQALDAETGEVKWIADCSDQLLESPKLAGEDTVLIQGRTDDKGTFAALDAETGRTKWERDFQPRWKFAETVLQDGTILLRRDPLAGEDDEAMFTALSPSTGETVWSLQPANRNWGFPVLGSDNRLFVELRGDGKESMVAIDAKTGNTLWEEDGEVWGQAKLVGSDRVMIAGRDQLKILDAATGDLKWTHQQSQSREPLVTEDSIVLGSSRTDGVPGTQLQGLDPQTGELMWTYDAPHLSGVAAGPKGQLLHHAYKQDSNRNRHSYLHSMDNKTGESLWSLEFPYSDIEEVGSDPEGRVTAIVSKGRERKLVVVDEGKILWTKTVAGPSASLVGNGTEMVLLDRDGMTALDADSGRYLEQVTANSPLTNYDGKVMPDGRFFLSGIDGEMVSMKLDGAVTVMEPSGKTPGRMRHYRYDIAENADGNFYADVEPDGQFIPGEDALLVSKRASKKTAVGADGEMPVVEEDLTKWDRDSDGYLSRSEMATASISLWWDRDLSGDISRRDGMVEMASEGNRQAVVDLDRQKMEVRNRPVGS